MKKLMVVAFLACAVSAAKADVEWSWWLDKPNATPDISLGFASRCQQVNTFEFSFFYSASPVRDAFQYTFFGLNNSDSSCPLQLAFINCGKKPCVQLGLANVSKASTFTGGILNFSDAAKFQLGFLNFNKKGFLPVFIFVNFDPSIFR